MWWIKLFNKSSQDTRNKMKRITETLFFNLLFSNTVNTKTGKQFSNPIYGDQFFVFTKTSQSDAIKKFVIFDLQPGVLA